MYKIQTYNNKKKFNINIDKENGRLIKQEINNVLLISKLMGYEIEYDIDDLICKDIISGNESVTQYFIIDLIINTQLKFYLEIYSMYDVKNKNIIKTVINYKIKEYMQGHKEIKNNKSYVILDVLQEIKNCL